MHLISIFWHILVESLHAHQCVPEQAPLKCVARAIVSETRAPAFGLSLLSNTWCFSGSNGSAGLAVNGVRPIRRVASRQACWNWSNCAISLGWAERTRRGVQCVNVIEHPDDNLNPLALRPAQFVNFKPQGGFFTVIGALDKICKRFGFGTHPLSDGLGSPSHTVGNFLNRLPARGRPGDLLRDGFKVPDLFDRIGQALRFASSGNNAVLQDKR